VVKGWARDLPVMLFVQVAEHHGICQQRVEGIGAGAAHVFAEPDRHGIDRPKLWITSSFPRCRLRLSRFSSKPLHALLSG